MRKHEILDIVQKMCEKGKWKLTPRVEETYDSGSEINGYIVSFTIHSRTLPYIRSYGVITSDCIVGNNIKEEELKEYINNCIDVKDIYMPKVVKKIDKTKWVFSGAATRDGLIFRPNIKGDYIILSLDEHKNTSVVIDSGMRFYHIVEFYKDEYYTVWKKSDYYFNKRRDTIIKSINKKKIADVINKSISSI